MPLMCLQCAMRAIVEGKAPETFDESPEAHLARVHPDAVACQAERIELEGEVQKLIRARIESAGRN
jgi:hypothetical protein